MIDFQNFVRWCENRFGDVLVKAGEVRINSVFTTDTSKHLYCSPSGGKNKIEFGCYHCFKSGKKGTLVGLVMHVDGCTFHEAKEALNSGNYIIGNLEEKIDEFFTQKEEKKPTIVLEFPAGTGDLTAEAKEYIKKRKLPYEHFYFCPSQNRIVIPYVDRMGNLIYYNSRSIDNKLPRYLGPPKTAGVGKSDVVYFPRWYQGGKVYLTEGEFDAMSLYACEFQAAACGGKVLSDAQILFLNDYDICLCLDRDNSGFGALLEMGQKLLKKGFVVSFVRPPLGYKDWNQMLVELGDMSIIDYIYKNEKPFDSWTSDTLLFNNL